MYCKNCGAENPDGTKFCSKCGQPLDAAQPVQQTVIVQAPAPVQRKRNGGALACGIIGFILSIIGAFIWVLIFSAMKDCADAINLPSSEITIRLVVIAILGIGGGIVGLVGAVQAFNYKGVPGIVHGCRLCMPARLPDRRSCQDRFFCGSRHLDDFRSCTLRCGVRPFLPQRKEGLSLN